MDFDDLLKVGVTVVIVFICLFLITWCSVGVGIINFGANQAQKVINRTIDADTAFTNYEWFHTTYNDILSTRDKIKDAYALSIQQNITDDMRAMYQVNYSGLTNFIRTMVSEYNAKSSMWNRTLFKDKNLPYKIRVEINGGDCVVSEMEG